MKTSEPPVIVEQIFNASVDAVWSALTELEEMHKWYFPNIQDFKAEVGFKTEFEVENEGRVFPHCWTITKVEKNKLLAYNWRYENYAGDSTVVFELFPQGQQTNLRVTCLVHEDFPDNIPEFKRESCVGGWTYFIQQSLKGYLD
jgi:uncharacterized protein YndB with AHSA1/START domain